MYFSEQGNVDDDATLITIFLVSFNLQSCCLMQSAVCSLQSANVIHRNVPWFICVKNESLIISQNILGRLSEPGAT